MKTTIPLRGGEISRTKVTTSSNSPVRGQRTLHYTQSTKSSRSNERTNGERPTSTRPAEYSHSLKLVKNGGNIGDRHNVRSSGDRTRPTVGAKQHRIPDKGSATIERTTGIPVKNLESAKNGDKKGGNTTDKSELVKTRLYTNGGQTSLHNNSGGQASMVNGGRPSNEIYSSHSFNSLTRPRVERSGSRASAVSAKPWRNGSLKRGTVASTPASASPMARTKIQAER